MSESGKGCRQMTEDVFGNLADWGHVLDQLKKLREEKLLDEHQYGLARMLRYRTNPHLMEQVLICALDIRQASDALIADVLGVVASTDVGLPFRTQAARVLGHLMTHRPPQTSANSPDIKQVVETMEGLAKVPGPPVLIAALEGALGEVRSTA